jgi:hypothetical protein
MVQLLRAVLNWSPIMKKYAFFVFRRCFGLSSAAPVPRHDFYAKLFFRESSIVLVIATAVAVGAIGAAILKNCKRAMFSTASRFHSRANRTNPRLPGSLVRRWGLAGRAPLMLGEGVLVRPSRWRAFSRNSSLRLR